MATPGAVRTLCTFVSDIEKIQDAVRAAMRQLKLVAAGGSLLLAASVMTACTAAPGRPTVIMEMPIPTVQRPTPTVAADLPLTRQACAAAAISAGGSTMVFRTQMAVIERAAARDDTGAMVAAAGSIQRAFVQQAKGLETMSRRPLSPRVRAAFRVASASLSEISSATYTGSTADISTRLAEVATTLAVACQ